MLASSIPSGGSDPSVEFGELFGFEAIGGRAPGDGGAHTVPLDLATGGSMPRISLAAHGSLASSCLAVAAARKETDIFFVFLHQKV
jgi:hypothetical protein